MSTASKIQLRVGDRIAGRYRLDGVVGKGGFGAVYEATHLNTGQHVALKVLVGNFSTSETDIKRFRREAALVQKLEHPNVVAILDFGETERGAPFIAFELLRGRALRDVLKSVRALSLERTVEIGRDVLSGLEAAHALGIVHRDIKPQNVFLCDDVAQTAKLLDFGVAKTVSEGMAGKVDTQLTEAGMMVGTPHYMAPEQVRGLEVAPTTDLYAVGLLVAEMLSGKRVVKADSLIEVYMAHIAAAELPLPEEVMRSPIAAVITKAVSKDPTQRYQSAADMREDLCGAAGVATRSKVSGTLMLPGLDALESTLEMLDQPKPDEVTLDDKKQGQIPRNFTTTATVIMDDEAAAQQSDAVEAAFRARLLADAQARPPMASEPFPASGVRPVPGAFGQHERARADSFGAMAPSAAQHSLPQISSSAGARSRSSSAWPIVAIVVALLLLSAVAAGLVWWFRLRGG